MLCPGAGLKGCGVGFTFYSDSVHESSLAVVVIYRKVPGCPIAPKRQGTRLPMESTGMFGACDMAIKKL